MELSVLNLSPLRVGDTFKEAIDAMTRQAQTAEKIGYKRFWLAEHHNTKSFASSATALLIQHVLANTKSIRCGAGGVMLPNHSPFVIAEYYGTLEVLYPGRVDLGLGRAPGTDQATAQALRRRKDYNSYFPQEVLELESYFAGTAPVNAYPATGLNVPFYILGSSTESAWLAAELGLPYAFAAHFAPAMLEEAVKIYRSQFKPSQYLDKPYVIVGITAVCADTNEEAEKLATSQIQGFVDIATGSREGIKPPVENEDVIWNSIRQQIDSVPHFGPVAFNKEALIQDYKSAVRSMYKESMTGDVDTVAGQIVDLKSRVDFDELMVTSFIYDEKAQDHSLELFYQAARKAENQISSTHQ